MKLISPTTAKLIGQNWYFNGRPCPKGHVGKRHVKKYECWECRHDYLRLRNRIQNKLYPEKKRVLKRAYKKRNKDHVNALESARQRRRKAAPGKFTKDDVKRLNENQGFVCAAPWCSTSTREKYHVDHNLPVQRGGTNWPENLNILCPLCNGIKQQRTLEEWARDRRIAALI